MEKLRSFLIKVYNNSKRILKEELELYFIIPVSLMLFLEFIIEPIFKVRKRTLNKFKRIPLYVLVIVLLILTFLIGQFLTSQYPNIDDRIFMLSCLGIYFYFFPVYKYEQYKKIK